MIEKKMSLICVSDFEEKAKTIIDRNALDYYRSGAGDEFTLKLNREAFTRLRIRPRFLRDVSKKDFTCSVLGCKLNWPFGISPTAMQRMAHPEGEIANVKAVEKSGCIFILSTLSTSSIEEVAVAAPNAVKWFQLYIYKDRSLTENLIRRAEKANFKALVLTVDAPRFGARRPDMRNKFQLPSHLKLANFTGVQAEGVRSTQGASGINEYVNDQFDASLTWEDLKWLVNFTKLPVILKGVLTREDAIKSLGCGCKGIIVSNHGARQIDGVPASIEALSEICKAVGDHIPVMMDGGVTNGTDIFKALVLGAKVVFIGRPALWGLAVAGQKGVENILDILRKDFELTMELTGCATLKAVSKDMVVHESYYAKY